MQHSQATAQLAQADAEAGKHTVLMRVVRLVSQARPGVVHADRVTLKRPFLIMSYSMLSCGSDAWVRAWRVA